MLAKRYCQWTARLLITFAYLSLFSSMAVAADPPVITVSPGSLSARIIQSLSPTIDLTLTISNSGGNDLDWSLFALGPGSSQNDPLAQSAEVSALDLTGVKILYYPFSIRSDYSLLVSALESRGATLVYMEYDLNFYSTLNYDMLWLEGTWNFTINELTALRNWVSGGEGLLLHPDNSASFNSLLLALECGLELSDYPGTSGYSKNIFPHVTTANVDSIFFSTHRCFQTVEPPADSLVNDVAGRPIVTYSHVGAGRIIALSDDLMKGTHIAYANNRTFALQIFEWLARSVSWIRFSPPFGTIAPGLAEDVTVTLVADFLEPGDYSALIHLTSNDPSSGEIDIPVDLRVDPYICGDINADGQINLSDLQYLKDYYYHCGPDPLPVASSDVDCDGPTGLADLIIMAQYLYSGGYLSCCD